MIETERLLLRRYTMDDFEALYGLLSDPETMQHYSAPYDEAGTKRWITWNLDNYEKYGFGLWAVVLKETAAAIGMRKIKEYPDPEDTVLYVYAITRSEWEAMEKDQNI